MCTALGRSGIESLRTIQLNRSRAVPSSSIDAMVRALSLRFSSASMGTESLRIRKTARVLFSEGQQTLKSSEIIIGRLTHRMRNIVRADLSNSSRSQTIVVLRGVQSQAEMEARERRRKRRRESHV